MNRFARAVVMMVCCLLIAPAATFAAVSTSAAPTLTGSAAAGDTLTCGAVPPSDWMSTDGGTPALYDYQWFYTTDETAGDEIYDALGTTGAPGATYTIQVADIGKKIVCQQLDEDGGSGDSTTANSPASNATTTVVAGAPPASTGAVTVDAAAEVGASLSCDDSALTWTPSGPAGDSVNTTIKWQYVGGAAPAGTPTDAATYTPVAGDVGKNLECVETASDVDTGGLASITSPPTGGVAPQPSVTITEYSPTVSGSIGESVAGVAVSAALEREDAAGSEVVVAHANAATDTNGAWTLTLSPTSGSVPDALGAGGDELVISYAGGSAAAGTALPALDTFQQGGDVPFDTSSSISAAGTLVASGSVPDCSTLTYVVDGTSHPTSADAEGCGYAPGPALTDNNHVQAAQTELEAVNASGDVAEVTAIDDVGLLGVPSGGGAPTCTADYVSGTVSCGPLNGGKFLVTAGSTTTQLTTVAQADGTFQGTATLSGLAAGGTIKLTESGDSRTLTALHLATLRVDEGLQGQGPAGVAFARGGVCAPYKEVGSSLCPASGVMPSDLGSTEFDDLSGGMTEVNIPSLDDLIPASDGSMPSGDWSAYADIVGAPSGVGSVTLRIVPHEARRPRLRSR